jgi:Zn-dependent protease
MFGGSTFRLFRWRDIDVFIDVFALLIIAFYVFSLRSGTDGLLIGLCVGVLVLSSVLVHELSHAAVGLLLGAKVERILLSVIGGVCVFRSKITSNWRDLLISIAGPASNLLLSFVFNLAAEQALDALRTGSSSSPTWYYIASFTSQINFWLGVFNMLPGFPLDGGQALRSLVLLVTRRELWAAWAVAVAGGGVGAFLVYLIIKDVQDGQTSLINIFFFGMLAYWIVGASIGQLTATQQLTGRAMRFKRVDPQREQPPVEPSAEGIPSGAVANRNFDPNISPNTNVAEFLERTATVSDQANLPVLRDGYLAGLINRSMARKVPRDQQPLARLEGVMVSRRQLQTVYEDDDLAVARLMVRATKGRPVGVLDRGGSFVGFISSVELDAVKR